MIELQDKLYIVPTTRFCSSSSSAEMVLKAAKPVLEFLGQKGHPFLDLKIFPTNKSMEQGQTQRFCSWAENKKSPHNLLACRPFIQQK